MADTTRKLQIEIELDDNGAIGKLRSLEDAGDRAAQKHSKHSGGVKGLSMAYTELSSKVNLLRDVWQTAESIINAPIEAAKEETARNLELIAAMETRGIATKQNISAITEYINAQSVALGVDDELLTKIAKIGIGYGGLSVEDIPEYIKATLGMAETTGKSAESAANAIAKWTNGSTPTLKGLNVQIDKTASGHEKVNALLPLTLGGYQAVIDKSATFEGSQNKLATAWGNVLSAIGNMLTTSPAVIDMLGDLAEWVQGLAEKLNENPQLINDIVAGFKEFIGQAPELIDSLGGIGDALNTLLTPLRWATEAMNAFRTAYTPIDTNTDDMLGQATLDAIGNTGGGGGWIENDVPTGNSGGGDIGNDGTFYTQDQIDAMDDATFERTFSSVKGGSRVRGRFSSRRIVSTGSPPTVRASLGASGGGGSVAGVVILNIDELARAIAGYSNLTLAEAQVG